MNKIFCLFLMGLFLSGTSLNGQTLKAFEEEAQKAFNREEYSTALAYYERALEIDPHKIENLHRVAETALIFHNYKLAEDRLLEVAAHEEWKKFPLVDFMLADAKKRLGKYAEAEELFRRFAENAKPEDVDPKKIAQARREVINCQKAPKIIDDSLDYITITNLENVNSPNSEFGAFLHNDNELYYSSLRFKEETDKYEPDKAVAKIYNSYNEAEGDHLIFETGEAEMKKHLAHSAMNADNNRMYYTECDYIRIGKYECNLFYRDKLSDTTWSAAVKLPDNINQIGYNTTQPNIGIDAKGQEWLFFSSNRPNGRGKMDIWCSLVQSNGRFSSPFNIRNINSEEDDVTPFFHTASQTLYFSSEANLNIGGFDIFKSEKDGLRYKDPVNMGYPLNTSYNDTYFSVKPNGRIGHLSSNRPGGVTAEGEENEIYSTCCNDIYKVDIEIKVKLIANTFNDLSKDSLLGTYVTVTNLTDSLDLEMTDSENHHFYYDLELDKDYQVVAEKTRYTSDTVFVNTENIFASTTIDSNLYLIPPIDLTALVFDDNTKEPLTGVSLKISQVSPDNPSVIKYTKILLDTINKEGHDFHALIDFDQLYRIEASKEGYTSAQADTSTFDLVKEPQSITKKLYLRPTSPPEFPFPIVLYFDNDKPSRIAGTDIKVNVTYEKTYDVFKRREGDYVREYTKIAKNAKERQKYRAAMESFFQDTVKLGNDKLKEFITSTAEYLKTGKSLEINIKGYASPRAKGDYNKLLTKRRIDCVKNQLISYSADLAGYIKSEALIISEVAEGEDKANKNTPDKDQGGIYDASIYSIDACKDRRVEIMDVNEAGLSDINN